MTDAPKDITSPPSPSEMLSPLKTISPFTVNVLDTFTSVKLPLPDVTVFEVKILAVTFCVASKLSVVWEPTVKVPIVNVSTPPVLLTTSAALFVSTPGVTLSKATSLPPPILMTVLASVPMNKLLLTNE